MSRTTDTWYASIICPIIPISADNTRFQVDWESRRTYRYIPRKFR